MKEPRTADVIARELAREENKRAWCRQHCERAMTPEWDSIVRHDPGCPLK